MSAHLTVEDRISLDEAVEIARWFNLRPDWCTTDVHARMFSSMQDMLQAQPAGAHHARVEGLARGCVGLMRASGYQYLALNEQDEVMLSVFPSGAHWMIMIHAFRPSPATRLIFHPDFMKHALERIEAEA